MKAGLITLLEEVVEKKIRGVLRQVWVEEKARRD